MRKVMEAVTVYVTGNTVCIQDQGYSEEDVSTIYLGPHQIDTLIEWLKEAKEEALQSESAKDG